MNQVVLAHELRHALQDQYAELHSFLDGDVSDFDDRRLAWTSLLEGDATLVMERFVRQRLGALGVATAGVETDPAQLGAPGLFDVPGRRRWCGTSSSSRTSRGSRSRGRSGREAGPGPMREAWNHPPGSTEQVLHPGKFFRSGKAAACRAFLAGTDRLPARLGGRPRRAPPPDAGRGGGWAGDRGMGRRLLAAVGREGANRSRLAERVGPREGRGGVPRRPPRAAVTARGARVALGVGGLPRRERERMAVRRTGDAVELASADDDALLDRLVRP